MRYLDFQIQIKMIENGKQIGYSNIQDNIRFDCAIQKRKESEYLVYFSESDMKYAFDDDEKEEFYSFFSLDKAIAYIVSRKIPFNEFKPRKGCNFFNINIFHEGNTKLIK